MLQGKDKRLVKLCDFGVSSLAKTMVSCVSKNIVLTLYPSNIHYMSILYIYSLFHGTHSIFYFFLETHFFLKMLFELP